MNERKIPTPIGLLLVAVLIVLFRFAFDRIGPLFSKAKGSTAPQQVAVTNVSDTSFTVSWITGEPSIGSIRLDGTKTPYADDQTSPSHTHSITVRNLLPETPYTFRLHGKPYDVRTAPPLTGLGTTIEPAYGQITNPSGEPAEGALMYLTLSGGQMLSTRTKQGGTWVIPLHRARTSDLTAYVSAGERIDETITIRAPNGEAHATTDTLNDNPVPVMTISKTYDFRKIQASAPKPPSVLGTSTQTVAITKPLQGAAIPSNLPLFQGTGVPGNQVLIVIGITNPVSDTFLVSEDGVWRYTPPKPLLPGKQSVTITTTNAAGKTMAITHLFEILKSGTQVLGDATPSATIEPTPTATLSGEPIPETGSSLPLINMLILGIALISSGAFVVYRYAR